MEVIRPKPVTNGLRGQVRLKKSLLIKDSSFMRKLLQKKDASYGRSSPSGRKSVWHKQRGAKRLYRTLAYQKKEKMSVLIGVAYNPNKSNFVGLHFDLKNRCFFYDNNSLYAKPGILAQTGHRLTKYRMGFRTILNKMPVGCLLNNICLPDKATPSYARAAGTSSQLILIGDDKCKIRLPSGRLLDIHAKSSGVMGRNSNTQHHLVVLGKAGINRNTGRRPIVRGIAMNPVDHPHGGRTNGGLSWVTPWGIPTKSKFKLRKKKKKKLIN